MGKITARMNAFVSHELDREIYFARNKMNEYALRLNKKILILQPRQEILLALLRLQIREQKRTTPRAASSRRVP